MCVSKGKIEKRHDIHRASANYSHRMFHSKEPTVCQVTGKPPSQPPPSSIRSAVPIMSHQSFTVDRARKAYLALRHMRGSDNTSQELPIDSSQKVYHTQIGEYIRFKFDANLHSLQALGTNLGIISAVTMGKDDVILALDKRVKDILAERPVQETFDQPRVSYGREGPLSIDDEDMGTGDTQTPAGPPCHQPQQPIGGVHAGSSHPPPAVPASQLHPLPAFTGNEGMSEAEKTFNFLLSAALTKDLTNGQMRDLCDKVTVACPTNTVVKEKLRVALLKHEIYLQEENCLRTCAVGERLKVAKDQVTTLEKALHRATVMQDKTFKLAHRFMDKLGVKPLTNATLDESLEYMMNVACERIDNSVDQESDRRYAEIEARFKDLAATDSDDED